MNRKDIKKFAEHFLFAALCIAFYFLLLRWNSLMGGINALLRICAPVVAGLVLAYVLNPTMRLFRRMGMALMKKLDLPEEKKEKTAKIVGIILTFLLAAGLVSAFLWVVIPELYLTVRDLTARLPSQFNRLQNWVTKLLDKAAVDGEPLTDVEAAVISVINYVQNYLSDFLENGLMERVTTSLTYVTTGVINVFRAAYNLLVGFVVSIYALGNRDTFIAQGKKAAYALFPANKADLVIGGFRKVNSIFSGFLIGKIIDSIIIGILAYICLALMKMPYALLNSVIIGCTNIIPIFGPFVGAVPCILLVLLVRPIYALRMGIFILILQQVDGNIIGPRILGDSTGLPGFWVLLALIFCGGIWGFGGMIVGVPLFATFYYLIKQFLEWKLRKRSFPTDTDDYYDVNYYDQTRSEFERSEGKKRTGVMGEEEESVSPGRGMKITTLMKNAGEKIRRANQKEKSKSQESGEDAQNASEEGKKEE